LRAKRSEAPVRAGFPLSARFDRKDAAATAPGVGTQSGGGPETAKFTVFDPSAEETAMIEN
jgi:hypothetical protein